MTVDLDLRRRIEQSLFDRHDLPVKPANWLLDLLRYPFALIRDLLTECARSGDLRDDVPPGELAIYCLHALTAAGNLKSKAEVRRLVQVTLSGLRAPR